MIQDIDPEIYDNSFEHKRAPENGDWVLMYEKGCVVGNITDDGLVFPTVEEVLSGCRRETFLPAHRDEQTELRGMPESEHGGRYFRNGLEFIFLFKIDETACFGIDDGAVISVLSEGGKRLVDQQAIRTASPRSHAFAAITGLQLKRWRDSQRYCGRCGGKMRPSRTERAFVCDSCGMTNYPKISPAVIVAVTHGDRILLTKYAGRTFTRYALIAGFAEIGETIEETVHREVMEEVGLKVKNLRFYKSQPWSFSDSILFGFFCELDGEEHITLDQNELAAGEFFARENMPERANDISLTSEMMELFRHNMMQGSHEQEAIF